MSRIVVTGSSGLIGTPLVAALRQRGDEVVRLVRRPPRGADEVQWDPTSRTLDPRTLDAVDGVVHLAGAGVGDKRWTPAYKHEILASRVDSTHAVAEAVAAADHPVRLVSGSAVGFYGDRGDEELTEASSPGNDFLSDVVIAWEAATQPAVDAGASVALLRTGIVMAPEGGAMKPMLRLARLGAGGALGSGRQFMPWITLQDEVGAIMHLLDHPEVTGPINLTASKPARQKEIAKALGAALHRPAVLPAPSFALRAVLGEFAMEVLGGQRIVGDALRDSGYQLIHGDLDTAVRWLVA
ncbi:MAG: TIGR01777 family oxidoreductase [Ornithinibacter sp.]